jgi:hypothetical protein
MLAVAGEEDEKEKQSKQEYTLLCDWMKQQLGEKVVKVSDSALRHVFLYLASSVGQPTWKGIMMVQIC